ncbi:MAG TPA: rhodanese-like domain-containing protein [Gammaproteobacteria bacterium]|nr:rhodanese-like domain-containing protein [Gammaproteobacteria bacterium]
MHEYLDFAARNWALVAALVVVLALLAADEIYRRLKGAQELTPAAAVQLLNRGALVIDCRADEDYRSGHIVGARNLSLAELARRAPELKRKRPKPVLAIGTNAREAGRAAGLLRRAGFESVFVLKGGLATWRKENLPLERPR